MNYNIMHMPHALSWGVPQYADENFKFLRRESLVSCGNGLIKKMNRSRLIRRSFTSSTGIVVSAGNGSAQVTNFEGPLEMAFYICCDFDRTVKSYHEQPCKITYKDPKGVDRAYYPDALVWFKNLGPGKRRKPRLIEVIKAETAKREGALHEWQNQAARAEAEVQGWDFAVMTEAEIYTPFWKNAKFLRRFEGWDGPGMKNWDDQQRFLRLLGEVGTTTIGKLLDLAAAEKARGLSAERLNEMRSSLMPVLYGGISHRLFRVNLAEELTLQSEIRCARPGELVYSPFQ